MNINSKERAAMSVRKLQNFVNGEYVEAKSGETSDVINPANGQVYATAPVSSAADVDAAYKAAAAGFEEWSNFTPGSVRIFELSSAMRSSSFSHTTSTKMSKLPAVMTT